MLFEGFRGGATVYTQSTALRLSITFKHDIYQLEDLLHDCVLSQIIVAFVLLHREFSKVSTRV